MPIDYRNMKEGWKPGESPADQAQGPGGRWWSIKDETSLGKSVTTITDSLKQQAAQRHQMNLVHARLYGNVDIISGERRDVLRRGENGLKPQWEGKSRCGSASTGAV